MAFKSVHTPTLAAAAARIRKQQHAPTIVSACWRAMVMCAAFSSCFIASVAAAEQHRRQLQSAGPGFTATLNDYQGITVESKQWQMLGLSVQQDMAPCAVTHDGALLVAAGNFGRSTSLYLSTHSAEDGTLVMEQAWTFAGSDSARALAISSDDVLAYVISRSTTDAGHAARAGVSKVHLHDDQVAPVTTVWSADPATDVLAEGVALWNDEALYIGGRTDGALSSFTNQGGSDFVLGRLRASDLTLSWELQWGTAAADLLSGVAVTQDGTHLFVSGHTSGQLPGCDAYGGSDFVLFKFTTAVPPALVWQKQWGTAANEIASLHMSAAITSDSASVVVTGNSGSSLATTKFSAALGAQLWFQLSSYSGVSDFARSMTLASDDMHGYLCGETSGTVAGFGTVPGGPTRFAVSKFSMASGTILWKQSWGTTSNDFGRGCTSGLDPNVLFLTGYRLVTHAAATKITAVPPVVANPVPIAAATAGETLSITVPVGTCTDANRNNSTIQVAGYVALTSGGSAGGDVGIGVTPGVQGAAMVSGTCTLVGDASLTVYLTCTNDLGASVQHSFDIVVTDEPPVVFNPIPSQTAVAGQPFSLVVPVDTFLDTITATANLTITGTVSIVAGGISGGSIGIAVTGGAPGTAEVSGTCTLVGDAMLEVALTCVDEAGASVVHSFSIEVSATAPCGWGEWSPWSTCPAESAPTHTQWQWRGRTELPASGQCHGTRQQRRHCETGEVEEVSDWLAAATWRRSMDDCADHPGAAQCVCTATPAQLLQCSHTVVAPWSRWLWAGAASCNYAAGQRFNGTACV